MEPTEEQMRHVMYYYRLAMGRTETAQVMHAILHWESIRPPCPELAQLKTILADPNAVRLNMLRGTIAWTPETLRSVLGEMEPVTPPIQTE